MKTIINQLSQLKLISCNIVNSLNSLEDLSCNHISIQQPPTEVGSAHIVSVPTGAKIFIDNIDFQQTTPAIISNISSGTHTYKLTYPGYTDVDGILFIKTGETYEISAIMEKCSIPSQSNALLYLGLFAVGFMLLSSRKKENTDHESIHEID